MCIRDRREIVQHLPPAKQLRILDVGCGAGFFSVLLANEGHRVTGIDLTPAMICLLYTSAKLPPSIAAYRATTN